MLPPFVLDGGFWRDFFTSAGFGGIMALAAAVVAFGAAAYSSHRSSYNALQDRQQRDLADQREQWWQRFTWATERALQRKTRDVGVVSMIGLVGHPWASEEDTAIAFAVADALETMDTEEDQTTVEGGTDEQI